MKEIPLTRGKVALVDDDMFEELNRYKWYATDDGYASRSFSRIKGIRRRNISMHRQIMGTPEGMDTDHIDHNRLNNQRTNLRVCTRLENLRNMRSKPDGTSKFKGVCADVKRKYYRAHIRVNGKRFNKLFPLNNEGEKLAAAWYNEMAEKHFGEFAHLNEICLL